MATREEILLGIILGEVYRLEEKSGLEISATSQRIYGLLNGFKKEIDNVIDSSGVVLEDEVEKVISVLQEVWTDKSKMSRFKGFYDIEPFLEKKGIDRSKAKIIITYLNLGGQFSELIKKMDSDHSPLECRTFNPLEYSI